MGLIKNIVKGFKGIWTPTSSNQLSPTDVIIAVIGATGSGKSTFISKFTGDNSRIGNDASLEQTTRSVEMFKCIPDSKQSSVVFIDTPGFTGVDVDDKLVITQINDFLRKNSQKGVKLSGLLYLHKISERRLTIGPRETLQYFKLISAESKLEESKVIFVTTLWDTIEKAEAEAREALLVQDAWDGRISRFDRELPDEEVLKIVQPIIGWIDRSPP